MKKSIKYILSMLGIFSLSLGMTIHQLDKKDNQIYASDGEVLLNEANFPDPVFRSIISNVADADKDGRLSIDEQEAITWFDIVADEDGIASVKGIEYFSQLTDLSVTGSQITELDLTKNTQLINLIINDTNISRLNLSNKTELMLVSLSGNTNLNTLDLTNCLALEDLSLLRSNISKLDLSGCPNLVELDTGFSPVSSVNLSENSVLTTLRMNDNQLTKIDLSANTELERVYLDNNQLSKIDFSDNKKLTRINVADNQLTELNLAENPLLISLTCSGNNLSNLDLSHNKLLEDLSISRNHLADLTMNEVDFPNLTYIVNATQSVETEIKKSDGKYILDLNLLVSKENLSKVVMVDGGILDAATGRVTYDVKPAAIQYTYQIGTFGGKVRSMSVTGTPVYKNKITFFDHAGNILKIDYVEDGAQGVAPADPIREGYTFMGWDKVLTNITDEMNFYPLFNINTYTIKFVDDDGTVLDTQKVEYGKDAKLPTAPQRTGYIFTGWDKEATHIQQDMSIKAQYKIIEYTVIFQDYDGTVISIQKVDYNTAANYPEAPIRQGHTFIGWNEDFQNVLSDMIVEAMYTINQYNVVFIDFDDTVLNEQRVEYLKDATAPTLPSREGYTFIGWDQIFTGVKEDLIIRAVYEKKDQLSVDIEQNPDINSNQTVPAPVEKNPNTGDSTNMNVMILLMLLSLGGMARLAQRKRSYLKKQ